MTDYLTEQEQVEILKKWLKQYIFVIIAGIVIAILTVTAWRFWQERKVKILTHASMIYNEMLSMRAQNNTTATLIQAQKIFKHYPKAIYGEMAAFMLAKNAATNNEYNKAKNSLNWVIAHSSIAPLRQIARIRLAKILLTENHPQESLKILAKIDDKSFNGLIAELTGDAYLAMHKNEKARNYYQKALTELPNAEIVRPILQMKYDNLATNSKE